MMIVVRLAGGMGNQLFQYAFYRALSLKYNLPIFLDTRVYNRNIIRNGYTFRTFDLELFNTTYRNIDDEIIKDIPIFKSIKQSIKSILYKNLNIPIKYGNYYIYDESNYNKFKFNPENNYYLDGYWQNIEYFKNYENIISQEITFKEIPPNNILELGDKFSSTDTVAIQIRKTDYVTNYINRLLFNNLDPNYFLKCVQFFKQRLGNPLFVIFSDDNNWVKNRLNLIDNFYLIDDKIKGDRFQYSMYLLSKCRNFIISNSSFGWWGAYLSKYENKLVIGPKKWFRFSSRSPLNNMPQNWLQM